MDLNYVKNLIEMKLPGSKAEIFDPRNDGKHLKAIVVYSEFKDKSLLEQHRMVLNAVKEDIGKDRIHALSIETRAE